MEIWVMWILLGMMAVIAAIEIYDFKRMTPAEKEAQVKAWLLGAVIWAEAKYGSGTGRVKLSEVWSRFCVELPWLAKLMSFERFAELVDGVLAEMRGMLATNKRVQEIIDHDV